MSQLLLSILVAFGVGGFAGTRVALARERRRNSKYRVLYYAPPAIVGALILYALLRTNPFATYVPALYVLGIGIGFLSITFPKLKL